MNSSLWDPSTLQTGILILHGICPLCGLESSPFVGSVHFVDLFKFSTFVGSVHVVDLFKFFTLVGFVHVVDWSFDPSWDPSTLWTCLSFRPLLGSSTLWTCLSFFTLVESVHVVDWSFDPVWDPSTLWTYFYPCWVCPHCGLVS